MKTENKIIKYIRRFLIQLKMRKLKRIVEKSQQISMDKSEWVRKYNELLQPKRDELNHRVNQLYRQLDSNRLIELYLIYFSSVGAEMVKHADVWLTNWGHGLKKAGFEKLGNHLIEHAKEETGHDRWHQNDVKYLVTYYNKKYGTSLQVSEILAQGNINCVQRYTKAYGEVLKSHKLYGSVGMLYETEIMTFTLAPQLIGYCVQELGFEIMRGLSFLRGHIVSDVGHVQENAEQLHEVLEADGTKEVLQEIVKYGEETVDIYIDYFEEVMKLAKASLRSQNARSEALTEI